MYELDDLASNLVELSNRIIEEDWFQERFKEGTLPDTKRLVAIEFCLVKCGTDLGLPFILSKMYARSTMVSLAEKIGFSADIVTKHIDTNCREYFTDTTLVERCEACEKKSECTRRSCKEEG